MTKKAEELVKAALLKVVEMRNSTVHCGCCGGDESDSDHQPGCPYPSAIKALDAMGVKYEKP